MEGSISVTTPTLLAVEPIETAVDPIPTKVDPAIYLISSLVLKKWLGILKCDWSNTWSAGLNILL